MDAIVGNDDGAGGDWNEPWVVSEARVLSTFLR
jgi:hypothetical protein